MTEVGLNIQQEYELEGKVERSIDSWTVQSEG